MTDLFTSILNMSITACYIVLAVIIIRLPLRKVPKVFLYALWLPVLIRLIVPVTFRSGFSFLNILKSYTKTGTGEIKYIPLVPGSFPKYAENPITNGNNAVNGTQTASATSTDVIQIVLQAACIVWIIGVLLLLAYSIFSYVKIKKSIYTAILFKDNIFESDQISTPFVFGFIKPKIYIPAGLNEMELPYVLEHERIHIRRLDYLIKPFAFFAVVLHWFNPFVWIAFALMSRDMEMSCDEGVLKNRGDDVRGRYADSLLSFSMRRSGLVMGSPLAFGESNVKSRIKNILSFKKPAFWVIAVSVIIIAGLTVVFATNPEGKTPTDNKYYSGYPVEALYKNKTPHVGNNSKVVRLVDALPLPEGMIRDMVELQTKNKPYGLTIHLKMNDPKGITKDGALSGSFFYKNAILLSSLIGNVDCINYRIKDVTSEFDGAEYSFLYTREMVEKLIGEDVRKYSNGSNGLTRLINRLKNLSSNESIKPVVDKGSSSDLSQELKNQFLDSPDGQAFQAVALQFAQAFFSGDAANMKLYLAEPKKKDIFILKANFYKDIESFTLKINPDDIKTNEVSAEYEFVVKGMDSLQYLSLEMKKIDGKWKIQFYGLEQ